MTTGVPPRTLGHGELLQLRRWNTPTIYNGWERITRHDVAAAGFNDSREPGRRGGAFLGRCGGAFSGSEVRDARGGGAGRGGYH
jgi:4-hydroxy-4-methyl-2-oxoglutarate aldolase